MHLSRRWPRLPAGRGRHVAISLAAICLVLLFLTAATAHYAHGPDRQCALCHATPHPEPFALAAPLQSPQRALMTAFSLTGEVNCTLVGVHTSMSFRGPPA
jgi:hypothetical protein